MNLFGGKKKVVEADKIPTTVEQAIPIQEIYEDGICLVGRNLWSKTFRFTDINYEVASREDKEKMFLGYSEILNSFDSGVTTKITVSNRRILRSNFEKNNMLREMGDSLDGLRYDMILERNVNLSTGVAQEKYMTITVEKQTLEEARQYFNRICAEFTALFAALGSVFEEVREEEKLRIFFDFFHHGEEEDFCYDRSLTEKRGHSFKDVIAPQSMEFRSDHFKIEGRYGRVLYLKDYANFIKDSFIAELTGIYILFAHEHSAQFLHKLWCRVRKSGGYVIGVTQNVEDLLDSPTAKFMLANSEYVIMLNQAATDRMRLAEVMKISESQMAYFTNTEAGHGLAKIGGAFVPFVNRLPKDTELYRMMSTKAFE